MVQGLRHLQGAWAPPLTGDLRSCMPWGYICHTTQPIITTKNNYVPISLPQNGCELTENTDTQINDHNLSVLREIFWLWFPTQGSNSHSCSFTLGTTREVLFLKNIIYLFLVALGLCCWMPAFSSCCEQGLLPDCGAWGFSLWWILLLQSTGSAVVVHGLSCSAVRGIVPDHGSNTSPPHWPADFKPFVHKGSPQGLSRHLEI